jgi:hypothetical protein
MMGKEKHGGRRIGLLILILMTIGACANYPSGPDSPSTGATYATAEDTELIVPAKKGLLTKDDPNDTGVLKLLTTGVKATENDGQVNLARDGSFVYIPPKDFNGTDSYVYSVQNQAEKQFQRILSVSVTPVNDPPAAKDDNLQVDEGEAGNVDVLANDSDVDGDEDLTVTGVADPVNGSVVNQGGGVVTYTPNSKFNGDDGFEYTVSDPHGAKSTARVLVSVKPSKDSLTAVDDSFTTPEEIPISQMEVLQNDIDPQGDPITIAGVVSPTQFEGTVTINADNTLNYVPAQNFFGEDTFTYTISTPDGSTSAATVTVTVTPVTDLPVAVADRLTTAEDTLAIINVLENDSDADGDSLTVTQVTAPGHGTAVINADYTITYTPEANFYGDDSFTYTLTANGDSTTAEVRVTVTPVDDPPVAVDDTLTTAEDTPATVDVLDNDSDVDSDLAVSAISTPPAHGTAVVTADDMITYTPAANYSGGDSFVYTIATGVTATVTVEVTPVDDPPVAVDDTLTIAEDTEGTVNVLANDSDIDSDLEGAAISTPPAHGTAVVISEDTITYTPADNYFGSDSFTYTVTANGLSDTATVTVTVSAVNDVPVLTIDAIPLGRDLAEHSVAEIIPDDVISDVDGAVKAIAVTEVDNSIGHWQYKIDKDADWQYFSERIGEVVVLGEARLLDSDSWIRFYNPLAPGGDTYFTFRAWDKSRGTVGETDPLSDAGSPASAFSEHEADVSVDVIIDPTSP